MIGFAISGIITFVVTSAKAAVMLICRSVRVQPWYVQRYVLAQPLHFGGDPDRPSLSITGHSCRARSFGIKSTLAQKRYEIPVQPKLL